ncbi:hypothetical protein RHGRI_002355 [Rhododendron griersonianum]|uniref:Uncharacterized protein n=1 Tax=Rhododendron griersonianum TaxID=479676 RepID=A0AAV6LNM3_9ERIC|nr:hypothetical protein RHGRI_002355 [Rhododendron griersonianum]
MSRSNQINLANPPFRSLLARKLHHVSEKLLRRHLPPISGIRHHVAAYVFIRSRRNALNFGASVFGQRRRGRASMQIKCSAVAGEADTSQIPPSTIDSHGSFTAFRQSSSGSTFLRSLASAASAAASPPLPSSAAEEML